MNSIVSPSAIARQIALTEAKIASSNQRLRQLRGNLRASAKHSFHANRMPLMIGGIALATLGLLVYPRRRTILARARWLLRSPVSRALVTAALPLIARFMPHSTANKPTNNAAQDAAHNVAHNAPAP